MVVLSSGSRNSRRGAGGAPASQERLPPPLGECGYGMNRQPRRTGPGRKARHLGRKGAAPPWNRHVLTAHRRKQPAARRRLKGIVPSRQTMRHRISGPNRVWIKPPARLYCRHACIERDCGMRGRRRSTRGSRRLPDRDTPDRQAIAQGRNTGRVDIVIRGRSRMLGVSRGRCACRLRSAYLGSLMTKAAHSPGYRFDSCHAVSHFTDTACPT